MTSFKKYLEVFLYAAILAILLLGLRFLDYKFILFNHSTEIYTAIIAVLFTSIGIWFALNAFTPKIKEVTIEKEIVIIKEQKPYEINSDKINELGISQRELEILNMLAAGLSNKEIGDQLYISLSTVKTHISNIYSKLGAKRRTQAIETARSLKMIV